jgi:protein O-mannosyl-transferase
MSRAQTIAKARAQARKKAQPRTPAAGPLLSGTTLNIVLCVLLAAVTIALYSPVLSYSFLGWDDRYYVTANSHIQGGLTWSTIQWAFTSTETAGYWHPLTWFSHALDYQLFALNPAGHHFDSVLIHALNAVLLFLLLAGATKRVGPSLLVAALFALHPLNVESVAWVAERKNVLSTLFFILAIGAYVWYAQKPGWRRYLLVAALFAAGLMAKPMVITLPFVLLLLDYWPLCRMWPHGTESGNPTSNGVPRLWFSRLLLEKVPLLFLSAASAWITLKTQRSGHAVRTLHQFPLGIRIENAVVAYGLYLWKMLWPARLAAFYPNSAIALPMWQVILSALLLTGGTVLVIVFRRKRYLPVGWFWFLGTLVPVIGLVQAGEQAMADRFAYVPLIGIFLMIAWGLDDWADLRRVRPFWRVIPALCALTALGFVTSRQMSSWKNEYTVWMHTLAATEQNPFAHAALGAALMDPVLAVTANNLEDFDTEQKRMDQARLHFERASELCRQLAQQNPDTYLPYLASTLNEMGNLDGLQNRPDEARQHYEEALQYYRPLAQQQPDPHLLNMATTLSNLAAVDRRQSRIDDARQRLEEALKIRRQLAPQNPATHLPEMALILNNLENLDGLQNRVDDARQHFEESLRTYRQLAQQNRDAYLPGLALALNNLGNLDIAQNRVDQGRQHNEEALKIYRQLALQHPDARYAADVARVEASLRELDKRPAPDRRTK